MFKHKKKAQVFLMSALLLASTAALGLSLVSVYLKNLKMVYQISESTKAFYLADACAEWRLYERVNNNPEGKKPSFYDKNLSCEYDPDYEVLGQIKTIGITQFVQRGINIYSPDADNNFFNF